MNEPKPGRTLVERVLVLSADGLPISVVTRRRAYGLIWRERAVPLDVDGKAIDLPSGFTRQSLPECLPEVPSVVRLINYIGHTRAAGLTRWSVLARDGYRCQYCGTRDAAMTIDHVIPKSQGGPFSWENLVCSCRPCNERKANRTPARAGMCLRRQPQQPKDSLFLLFRMLVGQWEPFFNILPDEYAADGSD